MKKRILDYRMKIDSLLEKNEPGTDWEDILNEHLVQISFFQHERLVHLIVTVIFAVLTVATIFVTMCMTSLWMLLLTLLFLSLLVPYIMHYYLLENETQKMYVHYDRMLEMIRAGGSRAIKK